MKVEMKVGDFIECIDRWHSYTKIHIGGIYEIIKIINLDKQTGYSDIRIINDKGYLNNYNSRCFKLNIKEGRRKKLKKLYEISLV